ncbi:YdcF family protein [Halobacillus shinanisalinarum]|uniref:YdcF family protein n=1 Tax=Halobacillus shinanisalinarum TaxID=2932258 RepID=A0ABY4H1W3_9BACI|nr:YdcF family protein [Halobacillus shinanisalinarum]UOQ94329.1 YdcF family protein [Halobacillus shinanisalinarum]
MKRWIAITIWLIISYVAFTGYSIWTYGENQDNQQAEAAIVLGAAQWNGEPSPVYEGRLKQGIELYKDGRVDYLIFTGGSSEDAIASEAEVGREYALNKGVPKSDIFIERTSQVTKENLSNAKQVAKKEDVDSFLIVSDQYHLKRAVAMAKEKGMDAAGVPTDYSAYQTLETKMPFFLKEWGYFIGYKLLDPFRS